ncbi:hypothetical protein HY413_03495 [Candidatus Kaiserbacteria bacterium]|nr:hypothetical protein [Candidatus Kaiserbacteria bacterium]
MENTGTQFSGSIRIAAALSVALLFAVIGAKWGTRNAPTPIIVKQPPVDLLTDRVYVSESDTDGDGIPDWLETLQGSDPRDPASSAASTTLVSFDAFAATKLPDDDSLTAQTINRMVDGYLALKDQGLYTPARAQELGQSIADSVHVTTPFTPYVMNDITVVADTSLDAALAHRTKMQAALRPLHTIRDPDILIYGRYLERKDPDDLAALSARAEEYRSVAQSIANIPVPKDFAETQLAMVNGLTFFASVIDNMVARVEDPFASMALLSVFNRSEQYVETTIIRLNDLYRIKVAS